MAIAAWHRILKAQRPALPWATGSLVLVALLLFLPSRMAAPVAAQPEAAIWSSPVNLSNSVQNSEYAAIVSDSLGYVHVFWSEDVGGGPVDLENPQAGNSIVYSRWDGLSWTPPVDVVVAPGESLARFVAVAVDGNNVLHAVWTGQANLYYSNAPSWQAGSAQAWSEPIVVGTDSARSSWESAIIADASGTLHIVFATRSDAPGIYHIRSQDGGATWGSAARLSAPFDSLETSFSNVQAIADGAGRLHVVWQTNQQQGYGQAVYYARSLDGGESWSAPLQMGYRDPGDYEASYPYLASVSPSDLHLIYLDGPHQGRSHRFSTDGGATWSQPYAILPEMEGVNGKVIPIVDGADQLHLIINMRTRADQAIGIYYARWLGSGWSPITPVDVSESASSAHYAAAAVRLGNGLHVVWTSLHTAEIWHVQGLLPSVRQTPPLSVPSVELPVTRPSPQPTASRALPETATIAVPDSSPTYSTVPTPADTAVDIPLAVSAAASLLLVAGVVLWKRLHPR